MYRMWTSLWHLKIPGMAISAYPLHVELHQEPLPTLFADEIGALFFFPVLLKKILLGNLEGELSFKSDVA